MKRSLVALFPILAVFLVTTSSFADHPPPPKSLTERVGLATHVFIGKAKGVRAVRVVDGRIQKVRPEPTHTGTASGVSVELDVEVQEVMFPTSWKPSRTVKVLLWRRHLSHQRDEKRFSGESLRVSHQNQLSKWRNDFRSFVSMASGRKFE